MIHSLRAAVVVAAALGLVAAPPAAGQSSSFSQLTGQAGCVADGFDSDLEAGSFACAQGRALGVASAVVLSPDDRHVYVAAAQSHSVAAFARDGQAGALRQVSCISDDGGDGRVGSEGACADGDALRGATDLAFSPDGRHLYVATAASHGISILERDGATGALTQRGCVKEQPRMDRCSGAPGLIGASGVVVSPDGAHVYVTAAADGALSTFGRDASTGLLTLTSCVSDSGSDGRCVNVAGLDGANDVLVAPDGGSVFTTAASGAVGQFSREPQTGALTFTGCLLDSPPKVGPCKGALGIAGAAEAALTPDGRHLYVAGRDSSAIAIFRRDPAGLTHTGCVRHQHPQPGDSVFEDEEDEEFEEDEEVAEDEDSEEEDPPPPDPLSVCAPAKALAGIGHIAVSPDGRAVFALAFGGLSAFTRDPDTGALRQTGCLEDVRAYKSCLQSRGLAGGNGLAASADGRNVYVASGQSLVAVLGSSVAVSASRHARVSPRGAVRVTLACPRARVRACAGTLRMTTRSTRGRAATPARYRLAPGARRAVSVRVTTRARRLLRRHAAVSVSVVARDQDRATAPSVARIVVRRARR